ncbi:hypothetical protein NQ315_006637 [Exocentrus adspersus]|uniref:Uncharacterized protein n=1 Tax=Exocentrus adspersus TaxID=1586481 RepID=A0AAV8VE68_9CUCU|nr:hypothetical protein NQ315_006637 [Exocentrus adspersus]
MLAWYFLYFQEYYHDSMNKELFEKWLKEKLLPTQPGGAIVNYYDNTPYHSALAEKDLLEICKKTTGHMNEVML